MTHLLVWPESRRELGPEIQREGTRLTATVRTAARRKAYRGGPALGPVEDGVAPHNTDPALLALRLAVVTHPSVGYTAVVVRRPGRLGIVDASLMARHLTCTASTEIWPRFTLTSMSSSQRDRHPPRRAAELPILGLSSRVARMRGQMRPKISAFLAANSSSERMPESRSSPSCFS